MLLRITACFRLNFAGDAKIEKTRRHLSQPGWHPWHWVSFCGAIRKIWVSFCGVIRILAAIANLINNYCQPIKTYVYGAEKYQLSPMNGKTPPPFCEPIDVVYTWINGSDPAFINSVRQFDTNYDNARFDDKNELKYSLRSLEKYAPWIRHIYIVTNGQIPKWLDLTNERITIVPHEVLIPNLQWLPIFSSAAIETFIHRIPNLSKRFLYLNDDIFLGAELYPEDLYTDSEGVRIYQAWLVPDCMTDCPWTYIGDGACDHHCNIQQCQYDGGDCSNENSEAHDIGGGMEEDVTSKKLNTIKPAFNKTLSKPKIKEFPRRKLYMIFKRNNITSFKDILIKHINTTNRADMRTVVENFNKQFQDNVQTNKVIIRNKDTEKSHISSISPDIFSQSLIYTNMLLNRRYGFKARHVMGHVGFLLEKSIIEEMHKVFPQEILTTATNRFRAPNDLQFAFLYYSFLMGETHYETVENIFNEFDTDHSLTWSDREIRTFLTRTFPLPLEWSAVHFFEEVIQNCSLTHSGETVGKRYTTLHYERYEDSQLPTVTREEVKKCAQLVETLVANFALRPKYKYQINPKRNVHNNFMMLTSNVTDVVDALDRIRRNPRKFNCINDNLDPQCHEDNELIRLLLEDFYLSLLPHRSQFELEPQYRNRFENWREYLKWRRHQRALLIVIYGFCIIVLVYIVRSICIHKAKFARFCIQKL